MPIRAQTLVCVIIFTRRQVPALNVNLGTQPVWILSLRPAQVESTLKLKQLHYSSTGSVLRFSAVPVHARVKFPNWKPRRNLRHSHTPWDSKTTDPPCSITSYMFGHGYPPVTTQQSVDWTIIMLIRLEQLSNASKLHAGSDFRAF